MQIFLRGRNLEVTEALRRSDEFNVLYRRHERDYGLIEPETLRIVHGSPFTADGSVESRFRLLTVNRRR